MMPACLEGRQVGGNQKSHSVSQEVYLLRLHIVVVASPRQRCDDDVAGAWIFASIANNSFSFTLLSRVSAQHILSVSPVLRCSRQHYYHQPSCRLDQNIDSPLHPSVSISFSLFARTTPGYSHDNKALTLAALDKPPMLRRNKDGKYMTTKEIEHDDARMLAAERACPSSRPPANKATVVSASHWPSDPYVEVRALRSYTFPDRA